MNTPFIVKKESEGAPGKVTYVMVAPRRGIIGQASQIVSWLFRLPVSAALSGVALFVPRRFRYRMRSPLWAALFSIGNVLAVIILGLLLFDRGTLENIVPNWQSTIGLFAFVSAAWALCNSLFGCFRVIGVASFWFLVTCILAGALFEGPAAKPSRTAQIRYLETDKEHHYFIMPTALNAKEEGSQPRYSDIGADLLGAPQRYLSQVGATIQNGVSEGLGEVSNATERVISQSVGSVLSGLSIDETRIGKKLASELQLSGGALPESAYFPRSLKGHKFYPSSDAEGSSISGYVSSLQSRFSSR